jgi:transcriptional regulator with XRE-family HTH domain
MIHWIASGSTELTDVAHPDMSECADRQWICGQRSVEQMSPRQTALGRLLQDRREAAGYSRTRIGELVGIKPGTIEGWELGRVGKPPIHDVLRLAHFLQISAEEIEAAVFADAAAVSPEGELLAFDGGRGRPGRRRQQGVVPLLEAGFRLFGWRDEAEAAEALNATADQVSRWRSGAERMEFADFLTLTSMIGVAAAEAMRAGDARVADLSAAAEALGVRSR